MKRGYPAHYWAVHWLFVHLPEENCRSRDSSKKIDLKIFLILDSCLKIIRKVSRLSSAM
jgi:hypothetical protein